MPQVDNLFAVKVYNNGLFTVFCCLRFRIHSLGGTAPGAGYRRDWAPTSHSALAMAFGYWARTANEIFAPVKEDVARTLLKTGYTVIYLLKESWVTLNESRSGSRLLHVTQLFQIQITRRVDNDLRNIYTWG